MVTLLLISACVLMLSGFIAMFLLFKTDDEIWIIVGAVCAAVSVLLSGIAESIYESNKPQQNCETCNSCK